MADGRLWWTLCIGLSATACGTDPASEGKSAEDTGQTAPTWSGDVRAVVAENCTSCHFEGGAAPFALETWAQAAPLADVLVGAVEAGRMPPWSPDPDCRTFEDERRMSESDQAVLRAWADAGAPEGSPTEPIVPVSAELSDDWRLEPVAAYTPDFSSAADDYRCQFLDHTFEAETWVTASQVVPGSAQVHHVLAFVLTGDQIDTARALESAESGPGYTCFSGPLPTTDDAAAPAGGLPGQVGAWVPGSQPLVLGEGEAIRVGAGAQVVMQVHYSAQGGDAVPSSSGLRIVTTDTTPTQLLVTRPLPVMDFVVPAGDPSASASHRFTNWSDQSLQVRTVAGHMHLLGQREQATIHHSDGTEACLLDIPEWDFAWQQAFLLPADDGAVVAPGDAVEVTCTWDNSAENQPVVDGTQADPVDVTWGEGTADEMCLLYLGVKEPYTPAPDPDAPACPSTCAPTPGVDALLSCDDMSSTCLPCAFDSVLACAQETCGAELFAAQSCMESCGMDTLLLGGAPGDCLLATCPDTYADLQACTDPLIAAGACDDAFDACGL